MAKKKEKAEKPAEAQEQKEAHVQEVKQEEIPLSVKQASELKSHPKFSKFKNQGE